MYWMDKSESEILNIADPIMNDLMEASTNRDYKKHIERFSDRVKAKFTEEEFYDQCVDYQTKWGTFTGRECIAVTRSGDVANVYWKQEVSSTNDEFLAVLTLSEENGRYVVERAFVDMWQIQS